MIPTVECPTPTTDQIAAALMACGGRYVTFRYTMQLKPSKSASALKAKRDTRFVGASDEVKAFMDHENASIWFAKTTNHWVVSLHVMGRRKALPNGEGAYARYGYTEGEYLPRTFRLDGIKLGTLLVSDGPNGKRELVPVPKATYALETNEGRPKPKVIGSNDEWHDGQGGSEL